MKKIIVILISLALLFSCKNIENIEKLSTESFSPLKNVVKNKEIVEKKKEKIEKDIHIKTPDIVESLYYSAFWIIDEKKFNNLLKIAKNTSINSVVIDIKEVDWYVSFKIDDNNFSKIKPTSDNKIKNISEIINILHKNNIYIIARIVVFKDNLLTKNRPDLAYKWIWNKNKTWSDYAGNKYLDAWNKEVWDYNLNIASEAYKMGFDEINFDYVRFPSDWKINQIYAPFSDDELKKDKINWKIKIINKFWKYIASELKKKHSKIVLSADVFWLVTNWDLNTIWQSLEWFLENFDYVAPMTYPSHYGNWFLGFKYPDNQPYEVLTDALKNSYKKIEIYNKKNSLSTEGFSPLQKKQIRLWLQWFSCTRCKNSTPYYDNKFKLQTKAIYDNKASWFWVWNANSNYYESWYK